MNEILYFLQLALLALVVGGVMGGAGLLMSWQGGVSFATSDARNPVMPGDGYNYQFAKNKVVDSSRSEVIRQRFYDSILYPQAGANSLNFFTLPQGQGVTTSPGAVVGSTKTAFDTNMTNASMLPSGIAFLIESIEIRFWAGSSAAANTYTSAVLGDFTAVATDATLMVVNDINAFTQAGLLSLNIMQKNYLLEFTDAFPTKTGLDVAAGISSNAAATGTNVIQYARNAGRPYYVDPALLLQPAVNFAVQLQYPGLVAMPSGFNGRVSIILDGLLSRAGQ